ncbi:MAG: response regulator [Rhizobacter sp.]
MAVTQSAFRVVIVEDDASIRRFVAMALEDLAIELVSCVDVAQAMQSLRQAPARLVLSDLMLPGESGLVLLERLALDAALRGDALLAVFSAGVNPQVRQRLEELGVWRILPKPASVNELRACIEDAMQEPSSDAAVADVPRRTNDTAERLDVIDRYYGGDRILYEEYHGMCVAQFPADVTAGDRACETHDVSGLRHLAHSLKTVLDSLGYPSLAQLARHTEDSASKGDLESASSSWLVLRESLTALGEGRLFSF